ncbi:MAG: ABC transporter permease, partial [Oscillospiraceae bacterium]|nr:ABC transporter permease [Oscillospiraceae bacterium]
MKKLSYIYNGIIFTFLYAPIFIMVFYSFNEGKSRTRFDGFSLRWYEKLVGNEDLLKALMTTLQVAVIAAVAATVIGTMAAVGIHSMNRKLQKVFMTANNIPVVNPEIVTGISLMLLFIFISGATGILKLGFGTLLLAHITFNIPYVILSVLPKLRQMNKHMYEAALDLGCPPVRAFFKVVIPEIRPGVVTGLIMAFTLSLDDFIISYF